MELTNVLVAALYGWKADAKDIASEDGHLRGRDAILKDVPAVTVAFSNVAEDLLAIVEEAFWCLWLGSSF